MPQICTQIDDDSYAKIRKLSDAAQRSLAAQIRFMLLLLLEDMKPKSEGKRNK